MATRKLSILGAGKIGRAVGRHWAGAGHEVVFGARAPETLADFVADLGERARAASLADAAREGEVVLLAVPAAAVDELLEQVRPLLAGKVVIDATNPIAVTDEGRIVSPLGDVPAGVAMAEKLPDSLVVRAFTHVMDELLELRGARQPGRWAMAIAGDDAGAKDLVGALVRDTGFAPVDIGGLADSRQLDPGGVLFVAMFTEADMRARLAELA
jgi:predicted dinucleotide-binding enzyme